MICFDVLHPYYLPQYLPVAEELQKRSIPVTYVVYKSVDQQSVLVSLVKQHQLDVVWVDNEAQALEYYLDAKPSWVIFGNAFSGASRLKNVSKTALMQHGVGPKSIYYTVSKGI
ncbi:hypothetical protein [Shewanella sp. MEBiC00475]|uniref:hypothetical protein n=1 Tax=Shewanella sp. MEBiC00475 TaxID=2575361 RepID=UPI0034A0C523